MWRKLALLLLPLALLVAACGGDGDRSSNEDSSDGISNDGGVYNRDGGAPGGFDTSAEDLFATINPLSAALGGLDALPVGASSEADPELAGYLLSAGDLPQAFASYGDFSLSAAGGSMAARMFATGDPESSDPGTIAMSMVLAMPPDAMDELADEAFDPSTLENDLFGDGTFGSFDVLDASDLGERAVGVHMDIDLSAFIDALSEAFGEEGGDAARDELPFESGISLEMFMFARGDTLVIVSTVWPSDQSAGASAHDLARRLSARTES